MAHQSRPASQNKNALYLAIGLGALSVISCFYMAAAQMPTGHAAASSSAHDLQEAAAANGLRP